MPNKQENMSTYKFFDRRSGEELEAYFEAYWEVALDPISDDYTPQEISTIDLLIQWAKEVQAEYPNNLIPIFWSVNAKGVKFATFEFMPAQYKHLPGMLREDFLTFFTHPISAVTGEALNWLTVPVVDKYWNSEHADKGGFIQQATGWKPSALQPYVYLPALMNTVKSI
jgi:hypothetical protein